MNAIKIIDKTNVKSLWIVNENNIIYKSQPLSRDTIPGRLETELSIDCAIFQFSKSNNQIIKSIIKRNFDLITDQINKK